MRKAEAERWSRALRSGKYIKYTGALRHWCNPNQCCVMGVAALVLPGAEWVMAKGCRSFKVPTQIKTPNESVGIAVPNHLLKLWAMHPDWARLMSMLNDRWHLTFEEMAEVVDNHYSEFSKPPRLRLMQMAVLLSEEVDERKIKPSSSHRRRTRRKVGTHNG